MVGIVRARPGHVYGIRIQGFIQRNAAHEVAVTVLVNVVILKRRRPAGQQRAGAIQVQAVRSSHRTVEPVAVDGLCIGKRISIHHPERIQHVVGKESAPTHRRGVGVQIVKERRQIQLPGSDTLIALIIRPERIQHRLGRIEGLVVQVIHVERFSGRQHEVGPARQEGIVGGVRTIGKTQDADPLRVAGEGAERSAGQIGGVQTVGADVGKCRVRTKHRQIAIGVVTAVAIQVEVVAKVVGDFRGGDVNRRARVVEEVGDVLLLHRRGERVAVFVVVVIDVRPVIRRGGIKAERIEKVGRHHQVEILVVGHAQDSGEQLHLGAFERGVRGEARGGLVGVGGDGIALAPAQHQESGGHEGDHRQHDERHDEGDAATGAHRSPLRNQRGGFWQQAGGFIFQNAALCRDAATAKGAVGRGLDSGLAIGGGGPGRPLANRKS